MLTNKNKVMVYTVEHAYMNNTMLSKGWRTQVETSILYMKTESMLKIKRVD